MERETSPCSMNPTQVIPSNYDELFMQHSLLFADSLKDLKNLRKQLYSAAEHFELTYYKDDQKQLVFETAKDYVSNALISTIDHLGSVAYKVNTFMDEKVNEYSGTNLRFCCIEQRLQTCQKFSERDGISQQSFALKYPFYHKHYISPVGETTEVIATRKSIHNNGSLYTENNLLHSPTAIQQRTMEGHSPLLIRQDPSRFPSAESPSISGNFTFSRILSNKVAEKRSVSPHRQLIKHAGSLIRRSISPNSLRSPSTVSRPASPDSRNAKQRSPSEPRRAPASPMRATERGRANEMEVYSKKSKQLFKALLSMRKPKMDDRLSKFTD